MIEEYKKVSTQPQRSRWFTFSWYNIRNKSEDSYDKTYNEVYQKNKEDYFKLIVHWNWNVPYVPFEGVEYVNEWNRTFIVFKGKDNLYWIQFKDSPRYDERAKWHFKLFKCPNDHCSCG